MSGIGTRFASSGITLVTTAETVAVTIPYAPGVNANPSLANPISGKPANYAINGTVNVTAGAAATSVQIRCRQGGLTGTVVGTVRNETIAAGNTDDFPFNFGDISPSSGSQAYVITVQQVAATGNGTVNSIGGIIEDYT